MMNIEGMVVGLDNWDNIVLFLICFIFELVVWIVGLWVVFVVYGWLGVVIVFVGFVVLLMVFFIWGDKKYVIILILGLICLLIEFFLFVVVGYVVW